MFTLAPRDEPAHRRYSAVAGLSGFDGVLLPHERHPERQFVGKNAFSEWFVGRAIVFYD